MFLQQNKKNNKTVLLCMVLQYVERNEELFPFSFCNPKSFPSTLLYFLHYSLFEGVRKKDIMFRFGKNIFINVSSGVSSSQPKIS